MKRKQLIEWQGLAEGRDFHVIPIRKRRREIGPRKVVQHRSRLGHTMSVACWCRPVREIRFNGSLLITHEDLPN